MFVKEADCHADLYAIRFFDMLTFQPLIPVFVSASLSLPPSLPFCPPPLSLLLSTISHLVPSVFSCFSRVFLLIPDFPRSSPGVCVCVCMRSQVSALWAVSVNDVGAKGVWGGVGGGVSLCVCVCVLVSGSCWGTVTRSVWEKFPTFPGICLG